MLICGDLRYLGSDLRWFKDYIMLICGEKPDSLRRDAVICGSIRYLEIPVICGGLRIKLCCSAVICSILADRGKNDIQLKPTLTQH